MRNRSKRFSFTTYSTALRHISSSAYVARSSSSTSAAVKW
jgi:hypothetical protein